MGPGSWSGLRLQDTLTGVVAHQRYGLSRCRWRATLAGGRALHEPKNRAAWVNPQ